MARLREFDLADPKFAALLKFIKEQPLLRILSFFHAVNIPQGIASREDNYRKPALQQIRA